MEKETLVNYDHKHPLVQSAFIDLQGVLDMYIHYMYISIPMLDTIKSIENLLTDIVIKDFYKFLLIFKCLIMQTFKSIYLFT